MLLAKVGGKVGEKESSTCTMKQKEATVCGRVSAAPIVATPGSPVGVKLLAETEKALSVGLEEMSQEHILADGKLLPSFVGALLCSVRDHCEGAEECERKEWKAGKR